MGVNARLTSPPTLLSFHPGEEHFFHISVNVQGCGHVSQTGLSVLLKPYEGSDTGAAARDAQKKAADCEMFLFQTALVEKCIKGRSA